MRRAAIFLSVLGLLATIGVRTSLADAPTPPRETVPAPQGELLSLAIAEGPTRLVDTDGLRQLIVDGNYADSRIRDLTAAVKYQVDPPGIVEVGDRGVVTPLADGVATVTAVAPSGQTAQTTLTVEGRTVPRQIDFTNQIVPIFTKAGCNAGSCHGKLSGQNGFRLSLLGFYPRDDYDFLVKEDRGRRVFPAAPANSLLLKKATNTYPHRGGERVHPGSLEHALLLRWIGQGMPPAAADDAPHVVRVAVVPHDRILDRHARQQLAVLAYSSDGTVKDVTHFAHFETNTPEMGEITPLGLLTTRGPAGDVAVMVRYQGFVDVFRGMIPLAANLETTPSPRNFIDEIVFAKLKQLGIPPAADCDDATFVRRVALDIAGRLPSAAEAQAFSANSDADKRDKWIEKLLASSEYADFFATKWSAVLRNRRSNERQVRGTFAFHDWIRESLRSNKPYDRFVRELVAASGDMAHNPAVVWYRTVVTSSQQLEDTAQLFLGQRIQCARCHHHPYEKWSQQDYYGFAAFFSQVGRKNSLELRLDEPRVFHARGEARATDPRSGTSLRPTGLGGAPLAIPPDIDPRQTLVDWMVDPQNPFFARSLVNRYWKHFLSRGLVEPEDDMRVTNPATNPELLDRLAQSFVDSHFDLKQLIRTICQSRVYQLSSEPTELNVADTQNFSRHYPKRLPAEVLYDALHQVTGTTTSFPNSPSGLHAVQLPDNGIESYFLAVFGKPQNQSACECERSGEATLAQALHLLNSPEVQAKLSDPGGRPARFAAQESRSDADKIDELYWTALARAPSAEERQLGVAHLARFNTVADKQRGFEDVVWALLNTKEFLFNH
ncbi:MAG TPA: DUF1549 and DUF1553 domain-containing protein [Pirellulales bacterium]|jgi:hypothetical protein|nr:DUF1549 and DUF1553 domain-containing protein [Pirellulales bacterium]